MHILKGVTRSANPLCRPTMHFTPTCRDRGESENRIILWFRIDISQGITSGRRVNAGVGRELFSREATSPILLSVCIRIGMLPEKRVQ